MMQYLSVLKGIQPGKVVEYELSRRKLFRGRFAISINEYPQTLGAIINGHRRMNTKLALKIEKEFGWSEGFLMTLKVYYDIRKEKELQSKESH